jgi:hypothetical protein
MSTPRMRLLLVASLAALCLASSNAGLAAAVAPDNDNYLESTELYEDGRLPPGPQAGVVDTTEATVQADLFSPPSAGGGTEATRCKGFVFGKTVWYDLRTNVPGVESIQTSGLPVIIAAYEYDPLTSRIIRLVDCASEGGLTTEAGLSLRPKRSYSIQIGGLDQGAGAVGGPLQLTFEFFADRDDDGIVEPLDRCPRRRGVQRFGGCLPRLRAAPRIKWDDTPQGIRIKSLRVRRLVPNALVKVRCARGCDLRQTRRGSSSVALTRFAGASLARGARIEVRVTRPASRSGTYRFGAIGSYTRIDIRRGGVHTTDRCLLPGSRVPRRRCR